MQRRWLSTTSIALAVALVAAACGGGGTSGPSPTKAAAATAAAATAASKGEIIIAVSLPTSGKDASDGLPAQNGAQFAVEQAGTIKGFTLKFLPLDDAVNGVHDPAKGVQNVQQLLGNPKVLGMVGPFNSNVAFAEIPVANRGSLAMVSPSNTNECLTQTFAYCNPQPSALRPTGTNNYFRVAAADTFQGPAMADYAIDQLKIKKIAVWSDNETFGKGVANNFSKEIEKKGGTIVLRQDFDTKTTKDWRAFLSDAKNKGAEGIYAAATSGTSVCIPRAQMKDIFTTDIPYMTPDGGVNQQCITDAGTNANSGMYGSVAAADAAQNPDAKATIDAFKVKFPKATDQGSYTFPSYDCARILIDAIGRAIDANGGKMPTREQVVKAVSETKGLKLTTGTYTMDKNGDPTTPTMAIFQLKGTPPAWTFVKQFSVGQ